jgi:alginate O-acetyltransferase complex protein AlgI
LVFTSFAFAAFLLAFWPGFRLLRGKAQRLWLLIGSLSFYGWFDWRFLGLLLLSAGVDFVAGQLVEDPARRGRRLILVGSLVANLGVLFLFKYAGWAVTQINALLPMLGVPGQYPVPELPLPVGLSFYTFQSMAYTIDVYRGQTRATRSPIDFLAFIAFFPQLVAGPIERSRDLLPQIEAGPQVDRARQHSGAWLTLFGFWKKLFVADNLAVLVGAVYDDPTGAADPWMVLAATWAFTLQIYCDFSGYSDIARGVARMLGYELTLNFDLPLWATSPQDLWRRWHISLSHWLRDYLYIPLGGSRHGLIRTQIALLLTMLLGGLWHGAAWTFVAWGAWHGVGLAVDRALRGRGARDPGGLVGLLIAPLMFQFTAVGFLWFRAHDLPQATALLGALADLPAAGPSEAAGVALRQLGVVAAPLVLIEAWMKAKGLEPWLRLPVPVQLLLAAVLFLCAVVLGASFSRSFIYFQF